ncbi:MAG: PE-PPE domain-containing protein [Actinomycetota bacterium]
MTTVLTLSGYTAGVKARFADKLDTALHGYANRGGARRRIVDYPQNPAKNAIAAGIELLQQHIVACVAAGDTIEIEAHSMGAEIVSGWLEQYATQPDAPSTDQLVRIILLGNPRRRFGGAWNSGELLTSFQFGGTKRTPTPISKYWTDDIARVGDPWANSDAWSSMSKTTQLRNRALRLLPLPSAHSNYDNVDPAAPGQLRSRLGNTAYWVAP